MIKIIPPYHTLAKKGRRDFLIKIIFRNGILFLFAFLLLVLSSCTQIQKARETTTIKKVVLDYAKGVIHASKIGDMKPLEAIASYEVLRKLYFWIAAWNDADMYMDAETKEITFRSINISGKTAKVLTAEHWIYTYKNLKTKQVTVPTSDISYEMEYTLKKDKRWVITKINIRKEERGRKVISE
jgi:hypothetical protein